MFTTTSEYALRRWSTWRANPRGARCWDMIWPSANIPANYLSKILWTLRNAGFLEAARARRRLSTGPARS